MGVLLLGDSGASCGDPYEGVMPFEYPERSVTRDLE